MTVETRSVAQPIPRELFACDARFSPSGMESRLAAFCFIASSTDAATIEGRVVVLPEIRSPGRGANLAEVCGA